MSSQDPSGGDDHTPSSFTSNDTTAASSHHQTQSSLPLLASNDAILYRKTFPQFSRTDERDAAVLRAQVETLKISLDDASLHLLRVQRENKSLRGELDRLIGELLSTRDSKHDLERTFKANEAVLTTRVALLEDKLLDPTIKERALKTSDITASLAARLSASEAREELLYEENQNLYSTLDRQRRRLDVLEQLVERLTFSLNHNPKRLMLMPPSSDNAPGSSAEDDEVEVRAALYEASQKWRELVRNRRSNAQLLNRRNVSPTSRSVSLASMSSLQLETPRKSPPVSTSTPHGITHLQTISLEPPSSPSVPPRSGSSGALLMDAITPSPGIPVRLKRMDDESGLTSARELLFDEPRSPTRAAASDMNGSSRPIDLERQLNSLRLELESLNENYSAQQQQFSLTLRQVEERHMNEKQALRSQMLLEHQQLQNQTQQRARALSADCNAQVEALNGKLRTLEQLRSQDADLRQRREAELEAALDLARRELHAEREKKVSHQIQQQEAEANELAGIRSQLQSERAALESLRSETAQFRAQAQREADQATIHAQQQHKELLDRSGFLTAQIQSSEQQLSKLRQQLVAAPSMEAGVDALKSQLAQAESELSQLRSAHSSLASREAELSAAVQRARDEYQLELVQSTHLLAQKSSAVNGLQSQLAQLQKELQEKNESTSIKEKLWFEENVSLKDELARNKAVYAEELKKLKDQIASGVKMNGTSDASHSSAESELRLENDQLKSKLVQRDSQIADMASKIAELKGTEHELQQLVQQQKVIEQSLSQARSQFESQLAEAKAQYQRRLDQKLSEAEQQYQLAIDSIQKRQPAVPNAEIESLRTENKRLYAELVDLRSKAELASSLPIALDRTVESQLRSVQQQYERRIDELRINYEKRVQEMAQLHAQQLQLSTITSSVSSRVASVTPTITSEQVEEQLRQLRAQLAAQFQQDLAREKRELADAHDQQLVRVREEHAAELQKVRAEMEAKQTAVATSISALPSSNQLTASTAGSPAMSRSASTDLESIAQTDQLRRLKAQLESNHRDAMKKLMRQLEVAYQSQIEKLEATHKREIARLSAAASNNSASAAQPPASVPSVRDQDQYEVDLHAMAERFGDERAQLQHEITSLQKQRAAHQLELQTQNQKHSEDIDILKRDFEVALKLSAAQTQQLSDTAELAKQRLLAQLAEKEKEITALRAATSSQSRGTDNVVAQAEATELRSQLQIATQQCGLLEGQLRATQRDLLEAQKHASQSTTVDHVSEVSELRQKLTDANRLLEEARVAIASDVDKIAKLQADIRSRDQVEEQLEAARSNLTILTQQLRAEQQAHALTRERSVAAEDSLRKLIQDQNQSASGSKELMDRIATIEKQRDEALHSLHLEQQERITAKQQFVTHSADLQKQLDSLRKEVQESQFLLSAARTQIQQQAETIKEQEGLTDKAASVYRQQQKELADRAVFLAEEVQNSEKELTRLRQQLAQSSSRSIELPSATSVTDDDRDKLAQSLKSQLAQAESELSQLRSAHSSLASREAELSAAVQRARDEYQLELVQSTHLLAQKSSAVNGLQSQLAQLQKELREANESNAIKEKMWFEENVSLKAELERAKRLSIKEVDPLKTQIPAVRSQKETTVRLAHSSDDVVDVVSRELRAQVEAARQQLAAKEEIRLQEVEAYEQKLQNLQRELQNRTMQLESTRQSAGMFEAQVQRLNARLSDLDSRAANHEGELDRIRTQQSRSLLDVSVAQAPVPVLDSIAPSMSDSDRSQISAELERTRKELADLHRLYTKQRDHLADIIASSSQHRASDTERISALSKENVSLTQQLKKLQIDYESVKKDLSQQLTHVTEQLSSTTKSLEQTRKDASSFVQQTQKETRIRSEAEAVLKRKVESLVAQLDTLKAQHAASRSDVDAAHKAVVQRLEQDRAAALQEVAVLKENIAHSSEKKQQLKKDTVEQVTRLEKKLLDEQAAHKSSAEASESRIANLELDLRTANISIQTLQQALAAKTDQLAQLQRSCSSLEERLSSADSELANTRMKLQTISQAPPPSSNDPVHTEHLQRELAAEIDRSNSLQSQLVSAQTEIRALQKKLTETERSLSARSNSSAEYELRDKIAQLTMDLESARSAAASNSALVESTRAEILRVRGDADAAEALSKSYLQQLEALRAESAGAISRAQELQTRLDNALRASSNEKTSITQQLNDALVLLASSQSQQVSSRDLQLDRAPAVDSSALQQRIKQLEAELREAQTEVGRFVQEHDGLERSVKDLTAQTQQLQSALDQSLAESESHRERADTLQEEKKILEQLQALAVRETAQLKTVQSEAILKAQQEHSRQLRQSEVTRAAAEAQAKALQTKLQELQQTKQRLESDLVGFGARLEQHQVIAAQLAADKKLLETRLKAAETTAAASPSAQPSAQERSLHQQVEQLQKHIEEIRESLRVSSQNAEEAKRALVELQNTHATTVTALTEKENLAAAALAEATECRERARLSEARLQAQLEAAAQQHIESAGNVLSKLVDTQAQFSEAQRQLVNLRQQLSDVQSRLDASEKHVVELQQELASKADVQRELQQQLDEREAQLGSLRAQHSLLSNELASNQQLARQQDAPDPEIVASLGKGITALESQLVEFEKTQEQELAARDEREQALEKLQEDLRTQLRVAQDRIALLENNSRNADHAAANLEELQIMLAVFNERCIQAEASAQTSATRIRELEAALDHERREANQMAVFLQEALNAVAQQDQHQKQLIAARSALEERLAKARSEVTLELSATSPSTPVESTSRAAALDASTALVNLSSQHTAMLDTLQAALDRAHKRVAEAEANALSAERARHHMAQELSVLRDQLESANRAVRTHASRVQAANDRISQISTVSALLQSHLDTKRRSEAELRSRLHSALDEVRELQQKLTQSTVDKQTRPSLATTPALVCEPAVAADESAQKIARLEHRLARLRSGLKSYTADVRRERAQRDAEMNRLHNEAAHTARELSRAQQLISQHASQAAALRSEVSQLQAKLAAAPAHSQENVADLEARFHSSWSAALHLRARVQELESQLAALSRTAADAPEAPTKPGRPTPPAIASEMIRLESALTEASARVRSLEDERSQLQVELVTQREVLDDLRSRSSQPVAESSQQKRQVAEITSKLFDTTLHLDQARSQIAQRASELHRVSGELQLAQTRIAQLEQHLAQSEIELVKARDVAAKQKEELAALHQEHEKNSLELDQLRTQLAHRSSEHNAAQTQLKAMIASHMELKEAHAQSASIHARKMAERDSEHHQALAQEQARCDAVSARLREAQSELAQSKTTITDLRRAESTLQHQIANLNARLAQEQRDFAQRLASQEEDRERDRAASRAAAAKLEASYQTRIEHLKGAAHSQAAALKRESAHHTAVAERLRARLSELEVILNQHSVAATDPDTTLLKTMRLEKQCSATALQLEQERERALTMQQRIDTLTRQAELLQTTLSAQKDALEQAAVLLAKTTEERLVRDSQAAAQLVAMLNTQQELDDEELAQQDQTYASIEPAEPEGEGTLPPASVEPMLVSPALEDPGYGEPLSQASVAVAAPPATDLAVTEYPQPTAMPQPQTRLQEAELQALLKKYTTTPQM